VSLHPTPHRKAFLRAVAVPGRVYREAGETWDKEAGCKVSARHFEAFHAGWVRVATEDERPADWLPNRVYYRLTPEGARITQKGQS
jgi:hypothetical protein